MRAPSPEPCSCYSPNLIPPLSQNLQSGPMSKRFAIALSFPGEHRDLVAAVADHLVARFGRERVLYDKYFEAEFARLDLDLYLPELYRTESELIVLFLCRSYKDKRWCKLEWRSIRQLIATMDAGRIMLLSEGVGDYSELGIFSGDGVLDFSGRSPEEIAAKIRERADESRLAPAEWPNFDIGRIFHYAPENLVGREQDLAELDEAWALARLGEAKRPRVKTFVALGGEGKTSLVAHWAARLAQENWPGCDAAFVSQRA